MLPLSSAIWPLMYRTLWDVGKRLEASCVHAAASAGFDMLMYTSAVRSKGRQGLLRSNSQPAEPGAAAGVLLWLLDV